MKVLICAYACDPYWGSEAGVGWQWSSLASMNHDVWVITDADNQSNIEQYLAQDHLPNLHFVYVKKTFFFRYAEKYFQVVPLLAWRAYICWQRDAYTCGMKLHDEIKFDLIHNLTYVGFRAPGFWYESDIPFVWGPLGGLEQTNLKLARALGIRCFLWYFCRNILNWRDKVLSHRVKAGMKQASGAIISASAAIQAEVKKYFDEKSTIISETVISQPPKSNSIPTQRKEGEKLKLIWIGRMIPGKGFPFVLKALRQLSPDINYELAVYGDGYCCKKWKKMTKSYGMANNIIWHGNSPHDEVMTALKESHVLLISSIYELTCTVAVEALSLGVPTIAPDICGFPHSVPSGCGIRFKADDQTLFVKGLQQGIEFMYNHEYLRQVMSENALKNVSFFGKERTKELINQVYLKKIQYGNN